MSEPPLPGAVTIRRSIDNRRCLLLAEGDFRAFIDGWTYHVSLWEGVPDGSSRTWMAQGLAAAVLHLANRPRNETAAWTLNLRHPPTNLFLTGSSADGTVTGRVITQGVLVDEVARLYVQTLKPREEPHTSALEVTGNDVLDIFEQYYAQSEQNLARFFSGGNNRFQVVLGLPGVDRAWLEAIGPATARELSRQAVLLEERLFRFHCGCTREKIVDALKTLFRENPDELFRREDRVEVYCPRCGRRWWVEKEQFR